MSCGRFSIAVAPTSHFECGVPDNWQRMYFLTNGAILKKVTREGEDAPSSENAYGFKRDQ